MKLVKYNGKIVNFDESKLETSILNSAKDVNFTMTPADVNMIVKAIKNKLSDLCALRNSDLYVSSLEVRSLTWRLLKENGFSKVADSYMNCKL